MNPDMSQKNHSAEASVSPFIMIVLSRLTVPVQSSDRRTASIPLWSWPHSLVAGTPVQDAATWLSKSAFCPHFEASGTDSSRLSPAWLQLKPPINGVVVTEVVADEVTEVDIVEVGVVRAHSLKLPS